MLEVLVPHHLLKSPKLNIYNLEATPPIANCFRLDPSILSNIIQPLQSHINILIKVLNDDLAWGDIDGI